MKHGSVYTYKYYKCRCEECRAAKAAVAVRQYEGVCPRCGGPAWNKMRKSKTGLCKHCYTQGVSKSFPIKHGTEGGYRRCHCRLCTTAAVEARNQRRRRAKAKTPRARYTYAEALVSMDANGGITELPSVPSFEGRGEGKSLVEVVEALKRGR